VTFSSQQRLIALIVMAFIIDYLPFINLPFLWSETFFHEISHGLAALITGGSIHTITINFNGAGMCMTSGGVPIFISFSGYAGSVFWGLFIYSLADVLSHRKSRFVLMLIAAMISITLALWVRDLTTILILIVLLMMYLLPLFKTIRINSKLFIQLVGVFVMLDAVRSPLYLLDGRDMGDGASLAEMTYVPELVWVIIWVVIALGCLSILWKIDNRKITKDYENELRHP